MPSVLLAATDHLTRPELLLLLLPLLLGAASIYLLLPRPEPFPTLWGALTGGVALVLGGLFVVRARVVGTENLPIFIENVLFYIFSAGAVVSGVLLVTQSNPARAALSFTLVVLSTCGLFLLLAAPFLMAATIIIYAGAIVVTFLFVLMLASQSGHTDADSRSREPAFAVITGVVLLAAILYVLRLGNNTEETRKGEEALASLAQRVHAARTQESFAEVQKEVEGPIPGGQESLFKLAKDTLSEQHLFAQKQQVDKQLGERWWNTRPVGDKPPTPKEIETQLQVLVDLEALLESARVELRQRAGLLYLNPDSDADAADDRLLASAPPPPVTSGLSGTSASVPPSQVRRDAQGRPQMPADNSAYMGKSLFTEYLVPVEVGGLLLLIATVGAIAIAYRHQTPGRAS